MENKSQNDKNIPENNVEQLIEKNKDKKLFLNFWAGMTYEEYLKVKEYENKSGNLKNDEFLIHPINFEVINDNESKRIKLSYTNNDNSPYQGNVYEVIKKYENDGLNEIIETLDKNYQRFDREDYISSIKTNMNFPNKKELENKNSVELIRGLLWSSTEPSTSVYNHISIFWRDNNRLINLEYTIYGDLKKSITVELSISYVLFNDFRFEIEKELNERKKEIDSLNKEVEQIEMETEKNKEKL